MACFLVSAAEAVVVTIVAKAKEKKEAQETSTAADKIAEAQTPRIPMSRKLKWLSYMLWGGTVLLAFEHVWHGEVVPWFPFLTAMSSPADAADMFREMATVGVCMALLITAVWVVMCLVANAIVKRKVENDSSEQSEQGGLV